VESPKRRARHAARRARDAVDYASVMATLGVFLALGGGAVAVTRAPRNSVDSAAIRNGAVTARDVRNGSLTGADVRDGRLTGADVAEESLRGTDIDESTLSLPAPADPPSSLPPSGPAGGDLAGSGYPDPQLAPDAVAAPEISNGAVSSSEISAGAVGTSEVAEGSLTGSDLGENTLTGAQISEATLSRVPSALLGGFARTGQEGTCDPESTTFVACGTASTAVPSAAKALVIGRVTTASEVGASGGFGECRLASSAFSIPVASTSTPVSAPSGFPQNTTVAGVVAAPAEPTTFRIECNQHPSLGAVTYSNATVTVLMISNA
jgi:hypothetical protein